VSVNIGVPTRAYSDVHGATLADIAGAIAQQDEAAKTEWCPTYTVSGGDQPTATVTVSIKITMPRWVEYSSASQAEKDEWDRFFAALLEHEQGHVDLVNQQLSGIDAQLAAGFPDDVGPTWETALNQLQSASDNYDTETDHGANQGTTINVISPTSSL
jgi:predicted secreted Zn-dependent protease